VFNDCFKKLQESIHGKQLLFVAYDCEKGIELKSFGKVGDGKKKSLIMAFDFAYSMFAREQSIKAPKFLIHDRLELTDYSSKEKAFSCELPKLDIQFVLPTIKSSIEALGEDFINENKILEISEDSKLFQIESYDKLPFVNKTATSQQPNLFDTDD